MASTNRNAAPPPCRQSHNRPVQPAQPRCLPSAALLRTATTVIFGYLCVGELAPVPLTTQLLEYMALAHWDVQQPFLLAVLCALSVVLAVDAPSPHEDAPRSASAGCRVRTGERGGCCSRGG